MKYFRFCFAFYSFVFCSTPFLFAETKRVETTPSFRTTCIMIYEAVTFESGASRLSKTAMGILDEVHAKYLDHSDMRLSIEGHTDSSEHKPEELSLERARAVREYLLKRGVAASRLKVKGWGKERPIDTDKTPEGRAKNRRVEFNIDDSIPTHDSTN